ncbi:MAG: aminotransferase class I/II-fold pyridoxal phosphate-dependent enzyme [Candidatus Lokiarchaeota archaeon]|nr:aminotransferase class I/II-fold pyridoxal phosphate-dependent enzyme [Candidatus Lokiarchaeota archaeon]
MSKVTKMNITDEEIKEVTKVLESQMLTLLAGNVVEKFEKEFAKFIGVKHAIGVNSGTAALHLAVASLNIGPGDEVIVPPFTFIATASSILHNNAIPIFADIDNKSYTLDPKSVEEKITDKTKAIIPVHLAGISADMGALKDIAEHHELQIIEDACQAHGAKYNNKHVGSLGDIGTFSFYPSKNMTTGEGGMITTNDDQLAETCRLLRHHGEPSWYVYNRLGWNYRMTEIQGAIGKIQLTKLVEYIKIRNNNANYMSNAVKEILGIDPPYIPKYCEPAFNYWIGRLHPEIIGMTKLRFLRKFPESKILYPKPLYKTKLFQKKVAYPKGCPWSCPFYDKEINYEALELPIVNKVTEEIFALDIHPKISIETLNNYIEIMKKIVRRS